VQRTSSSLARKKWETARVDFINGKNFTATCFDMSEKSESLVHEFGRREDFDGTKPFKLN